VGAPKGVAASGVGYRNDMVGNGRAIFVPFGMNGVRIKHSHLVGTPFPAFKPHFWALACWHSWKS